MLNGQHILVTGATGLVAFPIAQALAQHNDVIGLALMDQPGDDARLRRAGITPLAFNLRTDPYDRIPGDVTHVMHFAVARGRDAEWDRVMIINAQAAGHVLARCRRAKAFLHCSTSGVYQYLGHTPLREDGPLGDSMGVASPTYSLSKIAAESVVTVAAQEFGVPAIIARLNVPYGPDGGWPARQLDQIVRGEPLAVNKAAPNLYNPIYRDDLTEKAIALLGHAGLPPTVVNLAGSETVSIEEYGAYLGELVGKQTQFTISEKTYGSIRPDMTRMHALTGPTRVPWRDGMRRMAEARYPALVRALPNDRA